MCKYINTGKLVTFLHCPAPYIWEAIYREHLSKFGLPSSGMKQDFQHLCHPPTLSSKGKDDGGAAASTKGSSEPQEAESAGHEESRPNMQKGRFDEPDDEDGKASPGKAN